jgi:glycerophosphoryl diester phosphodiesterase
MTYQEIKSSLERQIPTLGEVFKKFPNSKFLIDAKSDEVLEHLAGQIIKSRVEDRVCCGSFYPHRIRKLHHVLSDKISYRLIVSRTPLHLYAQQRSLKSLKGIISAVDLPYIYLNKRSIAYLHKNGLKALIWTLNTPSQVNKAIACNADGIITDDARLLKKILGF